MVNILKDARTTRGKVTLFADVDSIHAHRRLDINIEANYYSSNTILIKKLAGKEACQCSLFGKRIPVFLFTFMDRSVSTDRILQQKHKGRNPFLN